MKPTDKTYLLVPVWAPGQTREIEVAMPDVERILRACVSYRQRTPGRLPGQTELLCRALLVARRKAVNSAKPTAPVNKACRP